MERESSKGLEREIEWDSYRSFEGQLPPGEFHAGDIGFRLGPYRLAAYAGKEVVGNNSRAEHLPYHCHIEQNGRTVYRIEVNGEKIQELDGKKIPRQLKKYLLLNSKEIEKRIRETFHTGDWEKAA